MLVPILLSLLTVQIDAGSENPARSRITQSRITQSRITQSSTTLSGTTQPNVVLLVADDLGYGEIAPGTDADEIPTPNIDRMSDAIFSQAYVTAPNCSPSRAGFLTGRFPTRFGYEFNPVGPRNEQPGIGLPASETTIAEMLQQAGYATGLIGKWHLGGEASFHPHRHGFDRFFGFTHEGHYYKPAPFDGMVTFLRRPALPGGRTGRWTRDDNRMIWSDWSPFGEPDYDANNPIVRDGQPLVELDYLTDAFTREAVAFIKEHRSQPFFLEVAYSAVHSPLQALEADMAAFTHIEDIQRRIFAGMLTSLDRSIGAVLDTLENEQLGERTVVVFFSDNGGPTRELTSSNAPLRGGKMDMYEGGIRVPMRMRLPTQQERTGSLEQQQTITEPVSTVDLLPTIATLAMASLPDRVDGIDLVPLLVDEDRETVRQRLATRPLFFRQGARAALRKGSLKLVRNGRKPGSAWELYDLAADPGETTDLSLDRLNDAAGLAAEFDRLNAEMLEPLFGPR